MARGAKDGDTGCASPKKVTKERPAKRLKTGQSAEREFTDDRVCSLCRLGGAAWEQLGPLVGWGEGEGWAHYWCGHWGWGVEVTGDGVFSNVGDVVRATRDTACAHCHTPTASVPCAHAATCHHLYHLPCLHKAGGALVWGSRLALCPSHVTDAHSLLAAPQLAEIQCWECGQVAPSEGLVSCSGCSRPTHRTCQTPAIAATEHTWTCAACNSCALCKDTGSKGPVVGCVFCGHTFHAACLPADSAAHTTGDGYWVCPDCVIGPDMCTVQPSSQQDKEEPRRPKKAQPDALPGLVTYTDLSTTALDLCSVCGSGGHDPSERLLVCIHCATTTHSFCAGLGPDPAKLLGRIPPRPWTCAACKTCDKCGGAGGRLMVDCAGCGGAVHGACADPPLDRTPPGEWRCGQCRVCGDCGLKHTEGCNIRWYHGYTRCGQCLDLAKAGQRCPVCSSVYRMETPMMVKCDGCDLWVHTLCVGMDEAMYDAVGELTAPMYCPKCCEKDGKKVAKNKEFIAAVKQKVKDIREKQAQARKPRRSRSSGSNGPTATTTTSEQENTPTPESVKPVSPPAQSTEKTETTQQHHVQKEGEPTPEQRHENRICTQGKKKESVPPPTRAATTTTKDTMVEVSPVKEGRRCEVGRTRATMPTPPRQAPSPATAPQQPPAPSQPHPPATPPSRHGWVQMSAPHHPPQLTYTPASYPYVAQPPAPAQPNTQAPPAQPPHYKTAQRAHSVDEGNYAPMQEPPLKRLKTEHPGPTNDRYKVKPGNNHYAHPGGFKGPLDQRQDYLPGPGQWQQRASEPHKPPSNHYPFLKHQLQNNPPQYADARQRQQPDYSQQTTLSYANNQPQRPQNPPSSGSKASTANPPSGGTYARFNSSNTMHWWSNAPPQMYYKQPPHTEYSGGTIDAYGGDPWGQPPTRPPMLHMPNVPWYPSHQQQIPPPSPVPTQHHQTTHADAPYRQDTGNRRLSESSHRNFRNQGPPPPTQGPSQRQTQRQPSQNSVRNGGWGDDFRGAMNPPSRSQQHENQPQQSRQGYMQPTRENQMMHYPPRLQTPPSKGMYANQYRYQMPQQPRGPPPPPNFLNMGSMASNTANSNSTNRPDRSEGKCPPRNNEPPQIKGPECEIHHNEASVTNIITVTDMTKSGPVVRAANIVLASPQPSPHKQGGPCITFNTINITNFNIGDVASPPIDQKAPPADLKSEHPPVTQKDGQKGCSEEHVEQPATPPATAQNADTFSKDCDETKAEPPSKDATKKARKKKAEGEGPIRCHILDSSIEKLLPQGCRTTHSDRSKWCRNCPGKKRCERRGGGPMGVLDMDAVVRLVRERDPKKASALEAQLSSAREGRKVEEGEEKEENEEKDRKEGEEIDESEDEVKEVECIEDDGNEEEEEDSEAGAELCEGGIFRRVQDGFYRISVEDGISLVQLPALTAPTQPWPLADHSRLLGLEVMDKRVCGLCAVVGDGLESGRLLPTGEPDTWVHANCALWSGGIVEDEKGGLWGLPQVLSRAKRTRCHACGEKGASVSCCHRCTKSFHFACAQKAECVFKKGGGVACASHAGKPKEGAPAVKTFRPARCLYVHNEEETVQELANQIVARDHHASQLLVYSAAHLEKAEVQTLVGTRTRSGPLCLQHVGRIVPAPQYHSTQALYPVGYSATRLFWSMRRPWQRTSYELKIVDGGSRPLFVLTSHEGVAMVAASPIALWTRLSSLINQSRKAIGWRPLHSNDGLTLLGLDHPHVRARLEQLPHAFDCTAYRAKASLGPPLHAPKALPALPFSLSGCARSDIYTPHLANTSEARQKPRMAGMLNEASAHRKVASHCHSMMKQDRRRADTLEQQYSQLKDLVRQRTRVDRSGIAGQGLYAKQPIEKGEMVIEYTGQVIRWDLSDKREEYYNARKVGCYMFRLGEDDVVDATEMGNAARFINHSCGPNCKSDTIYAAGSHHIVITAIRDIQAGEELSYDYMFEYDEENKVPCLCGAKGCRGWMN